MDDFASSFSQGMALGASMFNNSQRIKNNREDHEWQQNERARQDEERSQWDKVGKVFSALEQGNYAPAIAHINSSGQLGQDQYAAGARVDDKGHLYVTTYNSNDPVNSVSETNFGKVTDVKNQLLMTMAPPSFVAKMQAQMAQQSMSPMQQAQLRAANAGASLAETHAALAGPQGQSQIDHSNASTAALNQKRQQEAMLFPIEQQKAQGEAALAAWKGQNPRAVSGKGPLATIERDGSDGSTIHEHIYDPNDLRLKYPQVAPSGQGNGSSQSPVVNMPDIDFKANNIKTKSQLLDYLVSSGKAKNRAEAAAMLSSGSTKQ